MVFAAAAALTCVGVTVAMREQGASDRTGVVRIASRPIETAVPRIDAVRVGAVPPTPAPPPPDFAANTEIAFLGERFASHPLPIDPLLDAREQRLTARAIRMMSGPARFADIVTRCRAGMCEMSGRITQDIGPVDRAAAAALLQGGEFSTIGVQEGLEPGPAALTPEASGGMTFVVYLVAP